MNEPQQLLMYVATGYIPLRYRGSLQALINLKGRSLLRAAFYDELLQSPEKYPHPVEHAMKVLNASRATIFRDYKMYRKIFEEVKR